MTDRPERGDPGAGHASAHGEPGGPGAYDVSSYGERIADVYDDWPRLPRTTEQAVAFLAGVAGRGPILELGIGTGRIALPLLQRGFAVHGIDASPAMVAKLRAKPGGERIPVAMGDFADLPIAGRFSLIFVAFNTFFGLLSQDAQVRCFSGVAERLSDGGAFVIEAFVPDVTLFDRGQRLAVSDLGAGAVLLEASVHDPVAQRVRSRQILNQRGRRPTLPGRAPLCLAFRAGPHGAAGRAPAARALGRMGPRALRRRERRARLGLRARAGERTSMRTCDRPRTPAVTVDLDIMEDNWRTTSGACRPTSPARHRQPRRTSRPTSIPAIGPMQMEAGALGITCQKQGLAPLRGRHRRRQERLASPAVDPSRPSTLVRRAPIWFPLPCAPRVKASRRAVRSFRARSSCSSDADTSIFGSASFGAISAMARH